MAELKMGVNNKEGVRFDFALIIDIALNHKGAGEADKFIDECFEATKELVDRNWNYIEVVAQRLLEKQTISGKEVLNIMNSINLVSV